MTHTSKNLGSQAQTRAKQRLTYLYPDDYRRFYLEERERIAQGLPIAATELQTTVVESIQC